MLMTLPIVLGRGFEAEGRNTGLLVPGSLLTSLGRPFAVTTMMVNGFELSASFS